MSDVLNNLFENVSLNEDTVPESTNEDVNTSYDGVYSHTTDSKNANEIEVPNDDVIEEASDTPEIEQPKEVDTKPVEKSLSYDDVMKMFREEEKRKEEAKAAREEAKRKEEESRKAEIDSMPDPILDIEGFKKWQIEREAKLDQAYENKLRAQEQTAQVANDMKVIETKLNESRNDAETKFGKDVVANAEKWATNIINANPEYAVYLKENPSYEYIASEYKKAMDKIAFDKDPNSFIMNKFKELNLKSDEVSKPKSKVPPKSISSLTSAKDPVPEVPVYLKGLF